MDKSDAWSDDGSDVDEAEVALYFADESPEEGAYSAEVGKALQDCDAASSQSVQELLVQELQQVAFLEQVLPWISKSLVCRRTPGTRVLPGLQ